MKINMQKGESISCLHFNGCDIAIIGDIIDDRGTAAVNYLRKKTNKIIKLKYDAESYELKIDDKIINAENLETSLNKYKTNSVILEASTLGFVEVFLCCRVLNSLGLDSFKILYVEPLSYRQQIMRSQVLDKRDFELSEEFPGYIAIPGSTLILTDRYPQRGIFFLGYEERRLERVLEDYQMIIPSRCSVVFGVPAYKPGWEMDSFANNIRIIREKNIIGDIYFCGAGSPLSVIKLLDEIYNSLNTKERMFIVPIGTKPHGIGIALFSSIHTDVGILYDHPKRKKGRSKKVSKWHLFSICFINNK